MDRYKDDTISRDEWPLGPKSFDVVDRNKDGRLSRTELQTPNRGSEDLLDRQFRDLDANRDGRLEGDPRVPPRQSEAAEPLPLE